MEDPFVEGKSLQEQTASLRIWSRKEQREIGRIEGLPTHINSVYLSERKDLLWVELGGRELRCYDQRTGVLYWKRLHPIGGNVQPSDQLHLSADELVLFVRDEVVESTTGVSLLDVRNHTEQLGHGLFASAGRRFLIAGMGGCVSEFDWQARLLASSAVKELPLAKCVDRLGDPTCDGYYPGTKERYDMAAETA